MELFNVMNEMGKELDTARTRIADLERQLAAAQERERVLREMYERAALTPPPAEGESTAGMVSLAAVMTEQPGGEAGHRQTIKFPDEPPMTVAGALSLIRIKAQDMTERKHPAAESWQTAHALLFAALASCQCWSCGEGAQPPSPATAVVEAAIEWRHARPGGDTADAMTRLEAAVDALFAQQGSERKEGE
jgi:hypothetical protein